MLETIGGQGQSRLEQRAVQAWRELRSGHREPDRIEVLKGKSSKQTRIVCRLVGAHPAGPAVIGKRCRRSAARVEHTIYEEVLPHLPVLSLQYHGLVEEADTEFCWLFLEDAGEAPPDRHAEHRKLTARWLGLLHTSAAEAAVPRDLPKKEASDYLIGLQSTRDTIRSFLDSTTQGDDWTVLDSMVCSLDNMESHWDRVVKWCEEVPSTLVHGDFAAKNMRIRSSELGTVLLVFDWGEAGWGVPAADLSNAHVGTYWSVVRDRWPWLNRRAIQQLTKVGKILRCLDAIYWELSGSRHKPHTSRMKHLTILGSWLADAARAAGSEA